jgi:hypothetical protein
MLRDLLEFHLIKFSNFIELSCLPNILPNITKCLHKKFKYVYIKLTIIIIYLTYIFIIKIDVSRNHKYIHIPYIYIYIYNNIYIIFSIYLLKLIIYYNKLFFITYIVS